MQNKLKLIGVLLMVSIFLGCDPNDNDNKPTYYIDQDTKDFCVFNEGSWWVYENDLSGLIDTIRIIKNENHTKSGREMPYNLSGVYLRFSGSLNNTERRKWVGGFLLEPGINIQEVPEGVGDIYEFVSTVDTSFRFSPDNVSEIKLNVVYASVKVNDIRHYDVREITNLKYLRTNSPQTFWWARHIGIIKKQEADGSVWNLINYNVKQ